VILVSGRAESELRDRLADINPDAFVSKLAGAVAVVTRVAPSAEKCLNERRRGRATSANPLPPAQSGSAREAASTTLMLLRLGTRWFGVDVRSIEEVALKGEVTRVPTAPSHILGVTTLRGRLVTVVGLEQMIGGAGMLSRETTATLPRLVVVRDGDYEMAVVAEGIAGMTEFTCPQPTRDRTIPPVALDSFGTNSIGMATKCCCSMLPC
jgi:purine-binding chemotaxis protein CheW